MCILEHARIVCDIHAHCAILPVSSTHPRWCHARSITVVRNPCAGVMKMTMNLMVDLWGLFGAVQVVTAC